MRNWIALKLFGLACLLDKRLPKYQDMARMKDLLVYGTYIVKRIDPTKFYIDPLNPIE